MPPSWTLLVPLLPWLGALWIFLGLLLHDRGEAGEASTARVALTTTGLSWLGLLILDGLAWQHGVWGEVVFFPWLSSGTLHVSISMLLDRPALVMATLVAGSAFLTVRFAVHYLHREPGFHRFFAILCLFAGGMEWLALAGNAVLAFVGWEVAGLSSYLLIAYAYDRTTASTNATRAFITNRFGDAGFIFGIAMALRLAGGVEWSTIFAAAPQLGSLLTGVMVAGLLLAAVAKSAQIPFVAWISRALEGPTPSSAVFYGALMAHAGVFLVIRLEPVLRHSPFWMATLLLTGLATALFAGVVGLVQTDVKSALIYSTQAQIGFMFAEVGAGLFEFALWHLVAHSVWRLYQFLLAPSYLHLATNPPRPVPAWLAGRSTLYNWALHRFWFDPLADAILTKPTLALAQEALLFDEKVISRMAGRPLHENLAVSQGEWQHRSADHPEAATSSVIQGRGILGLLLAQIATACFWFEEHLVLSSSGDGLLRALNFFGGYVTRIEQLLDQPRYLFLMLVLTFVVIL